jgi:predicted esterase
MTKTSLFEDLAADFQELYGCGEHKKALDLLNSESSRFPDYEVITIWWTMRMLSLTGEKAGAIKILKEALSNGIWYHEDALHNMPDLAKLQGLLEFEKLVTRCKEQRVISEAEAKSSLKVMEPLDNGFPWPALLPLKAANPEFPDYWRAAVNAGWLVAIPQSSQIGWHSGLYVWDDIEVTINEIRQHLDYLTGQYEINKDLIVIAGFSRHNQPALQVALNSDLNLRGIIAVEAWIPDLSIWPEIVEASQNKGLRSYFIAGKDNTRFYSNAEQVIKLLKSHGFDCKLEGTSNANHRFPPEFAESLIRALSYIGNTE